MSKIFIPDGKEFWERNDGAVFQLVAQEYKPGDPACVGCHFKFAGSLSCKEAPTCTPDGKRGALVYKEIDAMKHYGLDGGGDAVKTS